MTFKLTVTYAAGNDQEHPGLDYNQAFVGAQAFMRDMNSLGGKGCTKVVVEIERTPLRAA